ncbi:MAG: glycosyltransferase [Micromonospora sp.]
MAVRIGVRGTQPTAGGRRGATLPTILHVAQPTDGGVARCVHDLVRAQVAAGWPVTLACPSSGTLAVSAAADGARVRVWPARRSPGPSVTAEARRLAAILAEVRPALIHLHSSKAGLVGRAVLRGRRPVVFQPHAWSFEAAGAGLRALTTAWERSAGRWADVTVCVSEAERQRGVRAGIAGPYVVVPNGVDVAAHRVADERERALARQRLGLGPGPLAVCVGRLCRQKGQTVLLEAWRLVSAALPGARLALVGDGPDRAALRSGAGHDVLLVGAVGDPREWYAAADVVVCPSRWEGMALVPLEAMARGRSVVASDVTGMREAVPPGAGALTPPGDVPALAAAVTLRLRHPGLAEAEGRVGHAHVARHHTVERAVLTIDRLYRRLLGLPDPGLPVSDVAGVGH